MAFGAPKGGQVKTLGALIAPRAITAARSADCHGGFCGVGKRRSFNGLRHGVTLFGCETADLRRPVRFSMTLLQK